jgi:hypothetical protein
MTSGRVVALAAVIVMASVGQCSLPEPKFPKLGGMPTRLSLAPVPTRAGGAPGAGDPWSAMVADVGPKGH